MPTLTGVIDRRILINYRILPEYVTPLLPDFLEPLIINGYASGGICLLRLKDVRPRRLSGLPGITSENAAHRFLVRFREGEKRRGVYIPRRETNSALNVFVATNLFSWPHYAADFHVNEHDQFEVDICSDDGSSNLHVKATRCDPFPADSMFTSLEDASGWFQCCNYGISPSADGKKFISTELKTRTWSVSPLMVDILESAYFENESLFPTATVQFDNALLMENIEHEWVNGEVRPYSLRNVSAGLTSADLRA